MKTLIIIAVVVVASWCVYSLGYKIGYQSGRIDEVDKKMEE